MERARTLRVFTTGIDDTHHDVIFWITDAAVLIVAKPREGDPDFNSERQFPSDTIAAYAPTFWKRIEVEGEKPEGVHDG